MSYRWYLVKSLRHLLDLVYEVSIHFTLYCIMSYPRIFHSFKSYNKFTEWYVAITSGTIVYVVISWHAQSPMKYYHTSQILHLHLAVSGTSSIGSSKHLCRINYSRLTTHFLTRQFLIQYIYLHSSAPLIIWIKIVNEDAEISSESLILSLN